MNSFSVEEDVEENFNDHDDILFFGAHVSNLLLQRCIKSIYYSKTCSNRCQPFMERFEGSLLFVDISGFTALSRSLNIELLKTNINDYFTKMLNVVDKFYGDVVKFAGDALYIVWPVSATDCLDSCVRKAFLCGIEITKVCNNYAVSLDINRFTDNAYMNVHSGISAGTMAAVDVGCCNRWEMLLIGQPLTDAAVANSQAKSGEIILSEKAIKSLSSSGALKSTSELSYVNKSEGYFSVDNFAISEYEDFESDNNDEEFYSRRNSEGVEAPWISAKKMLHEALLREMYASSTSEMDFNAWLLETQQKVGTRLMMDSIKVI
jgi:class 3 adenylate cyclase